MSALRVAVQVVDDWAPLSTEWLEADNAEPDSRGGVAAAALWSDAAMRTDWTAMLASIHGPKCPQCLAGSCPVHRRTRDDPKAWWHQDGADPGRAELVATVIAREADARRLGGLWRTEWPQLRRAQLLLQGQGAMATDARLEPGGSDSLVSVSRVFEDQISFLAHECDWPRDTAEAYTVCTCGGLAALGQAARDGTGRFAACRLLVFSALAHRARSLSTELAVPQPVHANLTGRFGLESIDPVWSELTLLGVKPGLSFRTSNLVMASSVSCGSRGLKEHVCCGGVREWETQNTSGIVRFLSRAGTAAVYRSMVHVGGTGFHLPAGAEITLVSIDDQFRSGGQAVQRKLYTVTVEFELDSDDSASDSVDISQLVGEVLTRTSTTWSALDQARRRLVEAEANARVHLAAYLASVASYK